MKKVLILFMVIFMFVGFPVKAQNEKVFTSSINSLNGIRYENYLVYYSYEANGTTTPTNQWGYEVAFNKDGVALEVGTNVKIPMDGFVLSGHGTKVNLLMNVKIGDTAIVNLNDMSVVILRDILSANKLTAKTRLEEIKLVTKESSILGVFFDEEEVASLISQVESKVKEINIATLEQSKTLIKEINLLADKAIYISSPTKFIEVRGVWHRPNGVEGYREDSLSGVQRLINKFKEVGFNTIYLETFWNGYASYNSKILETHPKVGKNYYGEEYGYDYVKAFIGEANKVGIDVHAWLHTFSAGSSTYKSKAVEDEWLVEDYQGNLLHPNTYGGSYYYDPSNPEVLDFVESVIRELATDYKFSGIQYDYIRYYDNNFYLNQTPIRDSGYGDNAEYLFKKAYNLTGDVRTLIKNKTYRDMWNEWRTSNITNAVKRFSKVIHDINPNLIISAAIVSNLENARNIYMQDWLTWTNNGYIDELVPMIYTGSSQTVKNDSVNIKEKLGNNAYLVSGIAPVYYGYSPMINHEQVIATNIASGNAIFASQNVIGIKEVEDSLKYGRYRTSAINISNGPKEIINLSLENLKSVLNKYQEKELLDKTAQNVFVDRIDKIILMEKNNPGELSLVLNELKVLSNLTLYISNDNIETRVKEDVNSLYNVIDIKISRYLINNDYWDPSDDDQRPDPLSFEYPDVDDENNEPVEPNKPEKLSNLKYWIATIICSLFMAINIIIFYRKRVKR